MSGNSCLEHPHESVPEHSILHWDNPLVFVTAAFLTTSVKIQIKQCGDLWHSGDSKTLTQNILCKSISRCHPNNLLVGPSAHSAESCSCSNQTISQNMEKHLSISVEHL